MEYLSGALLALATGAFATVVGLDRERSFYPVVLIVIASYYLLFAAMGEALPALVVEGGIMAGFAALAVAGFKRGSWLVVFGLAGHGVLDLVHGRLVDNPGVPVWWPMFCLTFDVTAAGYLAVRQLRGERSTLPSARALMAPRRLPRVLPGTLIVLGAALAAHDSEAAPRDTRTVQVDGHTVAYRVLGHGGPVLVLIPGLGDGMASFEDVAPELARTATVIVYDRAGHGGSGAATGSRDAEAIDRELFGLLRATGVAGPYVLLGHSLGGLYAEYAAAHHLEQVAGLILEESRPADFTRRCEAAKLAMCGPPAALVRFMPKGAREEIAVIDDTLIQVLASPGRGAGPVLVLSRPPAAGGEPRAALWDQAQTDLAARYPGARHLRAPAGGHYIHRDQRAWFLERVRDFLAQPR